ncbi:MAG TPA: hypothetical protein VFN22_02405 [Gemmatimonadales bacterium]|nr:hypothetical protein [Gemmatimonadales bacterium]
MVFEASTTLPPDAVLDRAVAYFAERAPNQAAFLERRSPGHLVLRGQGGEEVVLSARETGEGRTGIRASTLLFDHLLSRFLTTLPVVEAGGA